MTQKKTYLSWLLGLICAFSLMIVFLITSVEAVAYWTPHYYENEYTRYQVADDVHMEMDDLLYVTDEMMAYLRGSRDDLNIDTVVDGTPREFFNAREKAHMADVRNLFLGGLALRRLCLFLAAASVALLALFKVPLKHLLPRMLCAGTVLFLGVTALLAGIISTDFTKYFIIFHKIFFTNDLWQLDPRTDLLINIVPEPFFMDTAARIGITFCLMTGALFLLCFACILREHRRGKSGAENSGNSGGGSSPGSSSHPAAPDLKTKIAGSTGSKLSLFLIGTLLLSLLAAPMQALASTEWPSDISIDSDAGIVMDANTGVVLYGKNIHETYSPASITKVLTSLIVLEHCSLDETVTFSESAVYNVESNSSSAGYDTGDTASVKDCLYALLLKSATEAAPALAEHVAGSADAFAVLMNEKAAELGSAMGLSRLADCIYKGRGTRPGRTQARRMWKEAAESGEVLSMIALGDDCAARGETGRALIWYRKAREAAARMPDIEYTPQVCLRMAQTETRYTSRKKALALAAEARQGFALLAREQEPDAAQWLAEAEQLIRELTAEPPAQPAAYDMDSLQLD